MDGQAEEEQPTSNGNVTSTDFWLYAKGKNIDRQVSLGILDDAQDDFGEGLKLLEKYVAEYNTEREKA